MTRPGLEGITALTFLTATLADTPDLQALAGSPDALADRLWEGTAPDGLEVPWWITYTVMEPQDVKVVGLIHVQSEVMATIKVTVPGTSYGPAVPVYEAVHKALEGRLVEPASTGGVVYDVTRRSGLQFPERTATGADYRHLGGVFAMRVQ